MREIAPNSFLVGDRVHESPYTDCYPGTVVRVERNGRDVYVRRDHARVIDADIIPGGFAPVHGPKQKWECFENPDGAITKYTLRKNGRYHRTGAKNISGPWQSPPLRHGWRYYRDPNY